MATAETPQLLEREAELAELERLIERTRQGEGGVVIIEGPPGIGKTELVRAARRFGSESGLTVLSARGSELERDFAFGVVRQLFQAPLGVMPKDKRAEALSGAAALSASLLQDDEPQAFGIPGDIFPLLHGLHWLTANLAVTQPLLLAFDDAHWADEPSLRFLQYLAGRVEELPVLAIAASRSTAPEAPVALLEAARAEGATHEITLTPLSEQATGSVLSATFERNADPEFARASWEASGGNPFLVTEIARSLLADGFEPDAATAGRIADLSVASVSRSVLPRLAQMGPEAQELARWSAILGDGADIRPAAALSDIEPDSVLRVADVLAAGFVLAPGTPLSFTHPLIGSAIYGDLAPGERSRRHAAAARHLRAQGAPHEQVASHILRTEVGADPEAASTLRAAAAEAIARGAPSAAVTLLERASRETTSTTERHEVLMALAGAALLVGDSRVTAWRDEAIASAPDATARARAMLQVNWVGSSLSAREDVVDEMLGLVDELGRDRSELAAELEVQALTVGTAWLRLGTGVPDRVQAWNLDAPPTSLAERMRLAYAAANATTRNGSASSISELARRASASALHTVQSRSAWAFWFVVRALTATGAAAEALAAANLAVDDIRLSGSTAWLQNALGHRSWTHLTMGNVEAAASDALESLGLESHSLAFTLGIIYSSAIRALVERGDLAAAAGLWSHEMEDMLSAPPSIFQAWLLEACGELELARGDARLAVGHFERVRDMLPDDWTGGALFQWRRGLALAKNSRGDSEQARALADEELEFAREFGAPRVIGSALRVRGMIQRGAAGLADLRESVETLEGDEARLEYAKSLVELGAVLRRVNQRQESRQPLREGMELAHRCGAVPLAERARTELEATGARPRSLVVSGVASLTPSERRVAQLAAEGLTNREIAQQLFVTMKTVETHLRHCYQKLEISGRDELPGALTDTHGGEADAARG